MPGKVTPVVGYRMPGSAIAMPVVRSGTQTPEISSGTTTAATDWATRSFGVVRANRLYMPSDLGTAGGSNQMGFVAGTSPPFRSPTITNNYLQFWRLSQEDSDPSGYWYMNFSDDRSVQFDVGDTFYTQVQTYYSQGWFDQIFLTYDGHRQAGIKLFDVAAGHQGGYYFYTSANLKTVIQGFYELRAPHAYGYLQDPDSAEHPTYNFDEAITGDVKLQNALPACLGSLRPLDVSGITPAACFCMVPDTWQVWTTMMQLIDRVIVRSRSCFNFHFKLWGATLGQPRQLLIDWDSSRTGYVPLLADAWINDASTPVSFSAINLFPYLTDQSPTQVLATPCETRYREVIVSRNDIADPAVPNPTLATLAANTMYDCGPWVATEIGGSDQSAVWYRYSGFAYDARRRQMVAFGGGHASTNYNAINCFRLDTLDWREEYPPSPQSAITYANVANYDFTLGAWHNQPSAPTTRANSRHTEDGLVVVGDELIVLQAVEGNAAGTGWPALEGVGSQETVGKIAHYNFNTKTWSFANDSVQSKTHWYGTAYDPVSGKIVRMGHGTLALLEVYDPVTMTRTTVLDLSGSQRTRNEAGQVIDVTSGVYDVSYNNSMAYVPDDGTHQAWMDKFYYFARDTGLMFRVTYDRTTPTNSLVVLLNTSGTPCPPISDVESHEVRLAWDSTNKIIGVGPSQGTFYGFDPETSSWSNKSMQGGPARSVAFHCLQYCPVNNVFMFYEEDGYHMWAYRWN